MKPVLFVTGHAPPDRLGAFACLAEREDVLFALYGGRLMHGPGSGQPSDRGAAAAADRKQTSLFNRREVRQRELFELAASGDYRAVVCSTGGRVALPLAWAGTRAAGVPLVLWASLWSHPLSAAHLLSYPLLRRLYRHADAVVTYGPHVSRYVERAGARNVHIAPQAVDNAFWRAAAVQSPSPPSWPEESRARFLFVGRAAREKGIAVLLSAWRQLEPAPSEAALVLVGVEDVAAGDERSAAADPNPGVAAIAAGRRSPTEVRNFYAAADVLVIPSIPTRTFREPWGLVVNEAFNQHLPVIASDAVGAVAGGLVRDGENGLVVPAGDSHALAAAIARLAADSDMRRRLGDAGARAVEPYTYEAWAQGFSDALASVAASRQAPQQSATDCTRA